MVLPIVQGTWYHQYQVLVQYLYTMEYGVQYFYSAAQVPSTMSTTTVYSSTPYSVWVMRYYYLVPGTITSAKYGEYHNRVPGTGYAVSLPDAGTTYSYTGTTRTTAPFFLPGSCQYTGVPGTGTDMCTVSFAQYQYLYQVL